MKLHSGLDARHLMQMLGDTLSKEQQQWRRRVYKTEAEDEVTGSQRDDVINWIMFLNTKFLYSPETLSLTVATIDRFLQLVKVRPKYLHCIAITCYYIAAKTLEEDEVIPSTTDLVKMSQCSCNVSDILRMETVILNKFGWNIKTVTPVDCLHIIHALLMCYYPQLLEGLSQMTPSKHLTILTRKLFNCLACHRLVEVRPTTLVLALISLELEQIIPNWLTVVNMMQKMVQVDNESLIRCREVAGQLLTVRCLLPTGYKFKANGVLRPKSVKRKAEGNELEDDVYDGIKRLYSEDTTMVMSCGSEVMTHNTEATTTYPQIQTISAN